VKSESEASHLAQQAKEEKQKAALFQKEFDQTKHHVSKLLQDAGTVAKSLLQAHFKSVGDHINKLSTSLAKNAVFLAAYDHRAARLCIEELSSKSEAEKKRLLPQSKFAFKARPQKDDKRDCDIPAEPKTAPNTADTNSDLAAFITRLETKNTVAIHEKANEVMFIGPGDVNGKDVWIHDCRSCKVSICGVSVALRIHNVTDCEFYVGPVNGSIHIERATNCTFVIAARQIRMHHVHNCTVYAHVLSGPIIEHSDTVRFAPYNLRYAALPEHMKEAGLGDSTDNKWQLVEDFNWLRAGTASPNWCLLPTDQRATHFEPRLPSTTVTAASVNVSG